MERFMPGFGRLAVIASLLVQCCGRAGPGDAERSDEIHGTDIRDTSTPDVDASWSDAARDGWETENPLSSCRTASPVQFSGVFGNEASVRISTATGLLYASSHAATCGCLTRAELVLEAEPDCVLEVSAGAPGLVSLAGATLTIMDVRAQVGPKCAAIIGVQAGRYSDVQLKSGSVALVPIFLPCGEGPQCFRVSVDARLYGVLPSPDGHGILLEFQVTGDVDVVVEPSEETCPFACDCAGRECGANPCGGDCGNCIPPESCDEAGRCSCTLDCTDAECGDDGCSGSCGSCRTGWTCVEAQCAPEDLGCGCGTRACGQGGCGELCGLCPGDETCNFGACGTTCRHLPTVPGVAWHVETLVTPVAEDDIQEKCRDFTGDGRADNGLRSAASQVEVMWPPSDGRGTLFVLEPAAPGWTASEYFGYPSSSPGQWELDPAWLDASTCTSLNRITLEGVESTLVSHPSIFMVPVHWGDARWMFPLRDVSITGETLPISGSPTGNVSAVLTGVLTRRDLADTLSYFDRLCTQAEKKPEMCGIVPTFPLDHWFDLVYTSDGFRTRGVGDMPDAGSICLVVTMTPVEIQGFAPTMNTVGAQHLPAGRTPFSNL